MSFTLDVTVKNLFFDRAVVKRMVSDTELKGLSRIGAYLRRGARSSLRRRKRISRPGEPPSVHTSNPNTSLKKILFAYEPARHGVVVGPVLLNGKNHGSSQTVPELLEEGGVVAINEVSTDGRRWFRRRRSRHKRPGEKSRQRRAIYKPRPYMGPALQREITKGTIPTIFTARGA